MTSVFFLFALLVSTLRGMDCIRILNAFRPDSNTSLAEATLRDLQTITSLGRAKTSMLLDHKSRHLLMGTRKELLALKEDFGLHFDLASFLKPHMSDDEQIFVPLSHLLPPRPKPASNSKPRNGTCGLPFDEVVPLLTRPELALVVHDSPELILNMLRLLVGPKPDGTRSRLVFSHNLLQNFRALNSIAFLKPILVRLVSEFDPAFLENLANAIIDGAGAPPSDESN